MGKAWEESDGPGSFFKKLGNLPFYKALGFTVAYTFLVTPLVILFGFAIALCVNAVGNRLKGIVIFFSLLPMIITPLIGSPHPFLDDRRRRNHRQFVENPCSRIPDFSLKASPTLTWVVLFIYGIWHSAPFAFIVFYAGLQTFPKTRWNPPKSTEPTSGKRIRFVVLPHLAPLTVFIALIQLMDNFRVFEPIVGFNAEASATSLSWIIYNDLRPSGGSSPLFGSAAANSMLTILGVAVLMIPVLRRTWRQHKEGA